METRHWVRDILEKGPGLVRRPRPHGRKGLRSFSVSGRVKKPGVHLAPAGITVKELIDEYCDGMLDGHAFYGYLPGGASGGILPASMADIPLDFDTLTEYGCFIGSAAIVILSDHVRRGGAAISEVFFPTVLLPCTPCAWALSKAVTLMEGRNWDHPPGRRKRWSTVDRCLGQAAQ